ncbi:PAP/OAS1 substrate-binding domain-containing protein [Hortaea werneckii]|uniref:polynucleotide adenylyltransferase n=1 Tax=Hortaea werneckii TaxID=91943 RepID=A0A3M7II67_HORWE|nr:PAP/OAS1 substrate-binding domain-containing protein [Hortaea werneckii]KAI6811160.1 PAP/OAS1 substrate-binding domain-containing protein [Hortaea werneckii]KAI6913627.1 PAP/OAS1 substrate-binding domain-containing protein [Hortaea werneckii]KAI6961364.1 PAP/OAS1 substrate-binding domain-containing protein [Hortaea werneckii]KAI6972764.1 PAP/OAS1 substrate-binding domain-containing protein [Hortaea werneckii]
MDGTGNQKPGDFDEQLRRLGLNDGSRQVGPQHGVEQQQQPRVRLPSHGSNNYQQHAQGPPVVPSIPSASLTSYSQQQEASHRQYANVPPVGFQTPSYPPHKQSQRVRRMQPQAPVGSHQGGMPYRPQPHQQMAQQRSQYTQQRPVDPNAFQRGGRVAGYYQGSTAAPRQLFDPSARVPPIATLREDQARQSQYLERVADEQVPMVEMTQAERDEKESFRIKLQAAIDQVCAAGPERLPSVSLQCFGSFKSGFASAGSDMDLVIVLPDETPLDAHFSLLEDDLPRLLERHLLQLGHGARLLSRTRVPIIKICENPGPSLLDKLREEREKWDLLPKEMKYPHLYPDTGKENGNKGAVAEDESKTTPLSKESEPTDASTSNFTSTDSGKSAQKTAGLEQATDPNNQEQAKTEAAQIPSEGAAANTKRLQKPWTRERKAGPLDFPKDGVGIQCDINFFNPLGLHNTQLLRCYSLCDPRVRPIVLFVKSWAKKRKVNSSYSGTLPSYGYVLMVLHYLMNVARPPVIPNLQMPWRPHQQCTPHGATGKDVDGWIVNFWRNEEEIIQAVQNGQMSPNRESLGSLLAGFFHYYSSVGQGPKFHWTQQVISLRSSGGILTKQEKGWVKAVTEESEGKRVQHRYLFCIEDPFELSHNVARTVTHFGIVAIRDEFRRANRILTAHGRGEVPLDGELFAEVVEEEPPEKTTETLGLDGTADGPQSGVGPRLPAGGNLGDGKFRGEAGFAQHRGGRGGVHHLADQTGQPPPKALNTEDNDAFPALGAPKSKPAKGLKAPGMNKNMREISGDRAKAVLDDYRRRQEEEMGELTAAGAAEAVLGDD